MSLSEVLVTGGSGFVGGQIAARLAADGVAVVATVRRSSDATRLHAAGVRTVTADLADERSLQGACRGMRAVVHGAGLTRARNDRELFEVNAGGSERLARAAAAEGVERFLYLGSLASRGPNDAAPAGVDAPASAYGASKAEGEARVRAASPRPGWSTSLRLAAVYGPGDRDLLPLFAAAERFGVLPLPPRDRRFQPLYAADAADLVAHLLAAPSLPGFGPFAVAEPRAYRFAALTEPFAAALGRERVRALHLPPLAFRAAAYASHAVALLTRSAPRLDLRRAQDLAERSYTCDTEPLRQATGWSAATPLATGTRETVAWYRREGWLRR